MLVSEWNIAWLWWPVFVLLPLPFLIWFFAPQVKSEQGIYLPFIPHDSLSPQRSNRLAIALASIAWLGLITACARPVVLGEPIRQQLEHRDLMLVVDLSYSMSKEDMQSGSNYVDRLTAVKQVVSEFVSKRQGDRIGLTLFSDHAYLQTPLTLDSKTLVKQLNEMRIGMIGQSTAIGDGLGLATKSFVDSEAEQRLIILLSDGSNTAGVLDPLEAANIAHSYNTKIHTIGVGAGEMEVRGFFGNEVVNTAQDLDEKLLMNIASVTDGQYFRARDAKDLATIYDTIHSIEPIKQADVFWRPQTEWFALPLSIAMTLLLVLLGLRRQYV